MRLGQLVWLARSHGPIDVLLDLSHGKYGTPLSVWDQLFLHLSNGGRYWVAREAGEDDPALELATNLLDLEREQRKQPKGGSRRRAELARSLREIRVDDRNILVSKRGAHYLKLREDDAVRVLKRTEPSPRRHDPRGDPGR